MAHKNPFVNLYTTEIESAEKFVNVFSPVLVKDSDTHALFQQGNVILTGLQGSGKTALLNLLKPEIRIAYEKCEQQWPLPEHCADFISAGINLSRSSSMDFGQVSIEGSEAKNKQHIPLLFADFINYWIVDDLLNTIETIEFSGCSSLIERLLVDYSVENKNKFADLLSKQSCWFGGIERVSTYSELRKQLDNRIIEYREFLNLNNELPLNFLATKSSPGEPISVAAKMLKESGIISKDLPVFIRIDQFEDLMGLEKEVDGSYSALFRQMIMKMLGTRDDRVSYRVGARPYSISADYGMYGTKSSVEEMRNYRRLDLGDLLRGREARKSLFPQFCNDVFKRRLESANFSVGKSIKNLTNHVFGGRVLPEDKALAYAKGKNRSILGKDEGWPHGCYTFLAKLAEEAPLSAKLGEAWLRQQIHRSKDSSSLSIDIEDLEKRPWDSKSRQWWRKERIQQALLQISAKNQQRMKWYGSSDVVALSGRNILVFLSICQFVWAEFLRSSEEFDSKLPKSISPDIQDMGIQEASAYWFRKVKADQHGTDRHRFANVLGHELRTQMRDDRRMSYPGANGFSLPEKELEANKEVSNFLDNCVSYGVLECFKHTPKSKSRGQSLKWYMFPILSPYFQLPTPHTKEPMYVRVSHVIDWMDKADIEVKKIVANGKANKNQLAFTFDGD